MLCVNLGIGQYLLMFDMCQCGPDFLYLLTKELHQYQQHLRREMTSKSLVSP